MFVVGSMVRFDPWTGLGAAAGHACGQIMGIAFLLLGLLPLALLPEFSHTDSSDNEGPDVAGGDMGQAADPEGVLSPLIVDDVADPEATDPDGDILAPNPDAADTPSGQAVDGEVLDPIDEIESDSGPYQLDFEDVTGTGHAEIENFDTASDTLEIFIEPGSVQGTLDVDIVASANGADGMVYVEGQLVAVLKDAADAGPDNVQVYLDNAGG